MAEGGSCQGSRATLPLWPRDITATMAAQHRTGRRDKTHHHRTMKSTVSAIYCRNAVRIAVVETHAERFAMSELETRVGRGVGHIGLARSMIQTPRARHRVRSCTKAWGLSFILSILAESLFHRTVAILARRVFYLLARAIGRVSKRNAVKRGRATFPFSPFSTEIVYIHMPLSRGEFQGNLIRKCTSLFV